MSDEAMLSFFAVACEAKRDYENDPTDENQEAYQIARSAFRMTVIDEMSDQLRGALEAYLEAAEGVKATYEVISGAQKWFTANGLDSGLPRNFLKDIKLPNPSGIASLEMCGTESKMRVPFADYLTSDAEALFHDRYFYHDDHAREEREEPMQMKNYPKEFNAGLGR